MIRINRRLASVFFIIYLFMYLFQPAITRRIIIYDIDYISVLFILLNVKYIKLKNNKSFKHFIPFLLVYTFLFILKLVEDNHNAIILYENFMHVVLAIIHIVIAVVFIDTYMQKYKFTTNDLIRFLIIAATVQLVCVILSFLSPNIKEFFNSFTIKNSNKENIVLMTEKYSTLRSFGFAENLFDQFGFTVSLLTVISFAYGLQKKKTKYIILSFSFLFMSLVNARTGLLLSVVGIIIVGLYYSKKITAIRVLKGISIATIFAFVGIIIYKCLPSSTKGWIEVGLEEIRLFLFEHESSGTLDQLFRADIRLPSDIIFGAGGTPSSFSIVGIDNGYIVLLWMFGFVGSVFLLFGYLWHFRTLYIKSTSDFSKSLSIAFIALLLLYCSKLFPVLITSSNLLVICFPILLIKCDEQIEPQICR